MGKFLLRFTLILSLMFSPLLVSAQTITGIASVTDGDSLEIRGTRIRLHGIDAPESRQLCMRATGQDWRCGQQAALALSDQIGRRCVSCVTRDIDRYGRTIAVCSMIDGKMELQDRAVPDLPPSGRDFIETTRRKCFEESGLDLSQERVAVLTIVHMLQEELTCAPFPLQNLRLDSQELAARALFDIGPSFCDRGFSSLMQELEAMLRLFARSARNFDTADREAPTCSPT